MGPINLQYTTIKTPLPDFIWESLKIFSRNANAYHPQAPELISKITLKFDLSDEMLLLTAGNDEGIMALGCAFGKNTFVFTPTYTVYQDVREYGGKLNQISSIIDGDYRISTDKIPAATLVYLANPNNPSGSTPKPKVLELSRNNPQAIVVIDEAYAQFTNLSVIDQVKSFPNLVVLRSFSKDYGMAGNRIGFLVASKEIITQVKPKIQWANVSYLSVGAASIALDHEDYFAHIRQDINIRRDEFIYFLTHLHYQVFPSHINAVLLKFENETIATSFVNHLKKSQITVSPGNGNSNIGLDNTFVRITIGTPEQMTTVEHVISEFKL